MLAVYAAGFINAAGTTKQGFGCSLTKLATGTYQVLFGSDDGLVNNESYTFVTQKGASSSVALSPVVEDTSNTIKTIFMFAGSTVLTDSDLEIAVFRTVTQTG
jgi:hypothetical protein